MGFFLFLLFAVALYITIQFGIAWLLLYILSLMFGFTFTMVHVAALGIIMILLSMAFD